MLNKITSLEDLNYLLKSLETASLSIKDVIEVPKVF